MPDESCRSCGGELENHSLCAECRKATQKVCKACNALTRKQFHDACTKETITIQEERQVLQLVRKEDPQKRTARSHRYLSLILGIAGLSVMGFAVATYLHPFDNPMPNNGSLGAVPGIMQNSIGATSPSQTDNTSIASKFLRNCLAYGSGESLTVTCPTDYGYVYKAILGMPKDLAAKFSDSVFSIRGMSLIENYDGSVILQYQNNNYRTGFFAS